MKYVIDEDVCVKHGFTIDKVLLLLAMEKNPELMKAVQELMDNRDLENCISTDYFVLKPITRETLDLILTESGKIKKPKSVDYTRLADKLRQLYPEGRKKTSNGNSYSWRDSTAVIANKLKTLVIKYDFEFTEEQAIKAVSNYVEKNVNNPFMQVLKYYLLKNVPEGIQSEFMSDIENMDSNDEPMDWTTELR